MTLGMLLSKSIDVTGTSKILWPRRNREEGTIDMTSVAANERCYAVNNGVVCFVYKARVYATPYTREVGQTLSDNLFKNFSFFVPFSNGEIPKREEAKWLWLKEQQTESMYKDFESDSLKWSDEHHIGHLGDEILDCCFVIPRNGLDIISHGEESYVPTFCNEIFFDDTAAERYIGHYCHNNGRVVFIYRDGRTYLAKGYWILKELEKARFVKSDLFVPLSNGEQIEDLTLAAKWESLRRA